MANHILRKQSNGGIYEPYIHCAVREHIIGPYPEPDDSIRPWYHSIYVIPSTPFFQAAFVIQFTWALYTSHILHTLHVHSQYHHLWFYHHNNFWTTVRGGVGTALQAGRPRARFPIGYWKFHSLNLAGRTVAVGLPHPLTEKSSRGISWGVKVADV